MTPVERILVKMIEASGPISVSTYMEACLGHPEHGYYMTRDPLGAAGDFTTAPEISQMFGEMIGLWTAMTWVAAGRHPWKVIELGPGRGTLMADILRTGRMIGFEPEVWFVETSPVLRAKQAEQVPQANWVNSFAEVPEGPALILANEFFDALPVQQYLWSPEGWRERRIGLIDGKLGWGLSGVLPIDHLGTWVEISRGANQIAGQIASRIGSHGGAALIIDYGYRSDDRPDGPTLQAVKAHKMVDALTTPGEADLTWLINFDALGSSMLGLGTYRSDQGAFLTRLGIGQRAAALAEARPDEADAIADALERLTSPDQMGTLFKVLAVTSTGQPVPPGFGQIADPESAVAGSATW
ncbi:SAM-dependent methyltransferase [Rhodobacteraceae bacterium NNCM2]|nr:SAM-dependent methyltransferase [Coraliihabitans acroporae]